MFAISQGNFCYLSVLSYVDRYNKKGFMIRFGNKMRAFSIVFSSVL